MWRAGKQAGEGGALPPSARIPAQATRAHAFTRTLTLTLTRAHLHTPQRAQGEVEGLRAEVRERVAAQEGLRRSAACITNFLNPMWLKVHAQMVIAAEKKAAAKAGKDKGKKK